MQLHGVEYGNVYNTSGARNINGSGWRHDPFIPGKSWKGSTFVARTVTAEPHEGNLTFKDDGITTRDLFPKCIKVYWRIPATLNAVKLTNPGLEYVLDQGWWQQWTDPFGISLMAISPKLEDRLDELEWCADLLQPRLRQFRAPFFIQLNVSCANTDIGLREHFLNEAVTSCSILAKLKRPVMVKVNALTDVSLLMLLGQHPDCAGIVDSNAIGWNDLPKIGVNVEQVFGTATSPLAAFGGGALSGPLLHAAVCDHIHKLRTLGFTKPILKEGGNMDIEMIEQSMRAGADAIGLGCVAILRPWRVQTLIEEANMVVVKHLINRMPSMRKGQTKEVAA